MLLVVCSFFCTFSLDPPKESYRQLTGKFVLQVVEHIYHKSFSKQLSCSLDPKKEKEKMQYKVD